MALTEGAFHRGGKFHKFERLLDYHFIGKRIVGPGKIIIPTHKHDDLIRVLNSEPRCQIATTHSRHYQVNKYQVNGLIATDEI